AVQRAKAAGYIIEGPIYRHTNGHPYHLIGCRSRQGVIRAVMVIQRSVSECLAALRHLFSCPEICCCFPPACMSGRGMVDLPVGIG
ncbi:MAG: hypothetical protein VW891_17395, partial [Novosphingobium sp.]